MQNNSPPSPHRSHHHHHSSSSSSSSSSDRHSSSHHSSSSSHHSPSHYHHSSHSPHSRPRSGSGDYRYPPGGRYLPPGVPPPYYPPHHHNGGSYRPPAYHSGRPENIQIPPHYGPPSPRFSPYNHHSPRYYSERGERERSERERSDRDRDYHSRDGSHSYPYSPRSASSSSSSSGHHTSSSYPSPTHHHHGSPYHYSSHHHHHHASSPTPTGLSPNMTQSPAAAAVFVQSPAQARTATPTAAVQPGVGEQPKTDLKSPTSLPVANGMPSMSTPSSTQNGTSPAVAAPTFSLSELHHIPAIPQKGQASDANIPWDSDPIYKFLSDHETKYLQQQVAQTTEALRFFERADLNASVEMYKKKQRVEEADASLATIDALLEYWQKQFDAAGDNSTW